MSDLTAPDVVEEGSVQRRAPLHPVWFRPVTAGLVVAGHVAALAGFVWFAAEKITPLNEIRVEIVPQGETVTETSTVPTPESAPTVTLEPAELTSPDPEMRNDPDVAKPVEQMAEAEPVPDLALPPPKIENPDAPPLPVERPRPQKIEKTKTLVAQPAQRTKVSKIKESLRRAALRALKRAKAAAHARRLSAQAQIGAAAVRAGVKEGSGEAPRMSNAAYAALVSAEINRHKHYPAGARETGATGAVGVVFSIGPSGAIVSHSITRSSGNGAIDGTVHQMMAASHPPPPPGGHFRGSVTISFNLAR